MKKIISKIWIFSLLILLIYSHVQAWCYDLIIKKITHDTDYSLNANPIINITISNPSTTICNQSFPAWFISCLQDLSTVFESSAIPTFILNAWSEITAWNLKLSNSISEEKWEKTINCRLSTNPLLTNTWFKINIIEANRFDVSLNKSISSIKWNLDPAELSLWVQWLQNFVFKKTMDIIFPIILVVGLLTAMMWFYKLLFSDSEDATKDWVKFIIYWVLWIIIITSAKYIWWVLFNDLFVSWNMTEMSPIYIAQGLYEKIAFPFIKILIYLVLWFLFISLAFRVFTFIIAADDSIKKKAWWIILRDAVAMLIIIWSKQIIEAIYGKKEQVLNANATDLWQIWSWILADKNIPILYTVISRILWLSALVILIIIIIQSLQLLLKPDDADKIKKIRKSIIYIFIWVLVIWTWYILTNVLIIN